MKSVLLFAICSLLLAGNVSAQTDFHDQSYLAAPFCYDVNPYHGVTITTAVNGRIARPYFPFSYQDMGHLKVRQLGERIGLDKMMAETDSELELIITLADWANGLWGHMRPLPFPSWDAHEILDRVDAGDSFFCTYKAVLFAQACNAAGLSARLLGISTKHGAAHTVTEVYSNEYRKWMLVDPWMNCWFERDGIPVSALEVHNAIDNPEGIFLNVGPHGFFKEQKDYRIGAADSMPLAGKRIPLAEEKRAELYYDLRLVMRNDHITHPQSTESLDEDGFMIPYNPRGIDWWGPQLKWTDDTTPLSITIDNTNNINDFEWVLNEVHVTLRKTSQPGEPLTLKAAFSTLTPSFDRYRLLIDGEEIPLSADSFTWRLNTGVNSLKISSINVLGRAGFPSEFVLEYDPASVDYSAPVTVSLPDPGMETAGDDGLPAHWNAVTANGLKYREFSLDSSVKHSGRHAIKASPAQDPTSGIDYAFFLMSERFKVNPARDVVYSVWLKADADDTPAYIFLWDESRNGLGAGQFHKAVTLGTSWQRYEIKCRLHNELTLASVGVKVLTGTVWADDAEYVEIGR